MGENRQKTFEESLPPGYKEIYHIDATDKKTATKLTLWSFALCIVCLIPLFISCDYRAIEHGQLWIYYIIFLFAMVIYMVLHELVHGAVYKLRTHRKLRFGITLTCAFCGVPDVWVYRSTALLSLCAPLVVFSVIFLTLMAVFYRANMTLYMLFGLLFSVHFSGCIGDMYVLWLFIKRFKDPRTLMNDTGPAQRFCVPDDDAGQQ